MYTTCTNTQWKETSNNSYYENNTAMVVISANTSLSRTLSQCLLIQSEELAISAINVEKKNPNSSPGKESLMEVGILPFWFLIMENLYGKA